MQGKILRKELNFASAIRSFIGYLEGTSKSMHTIKNYRLDLAAFESFITKTYSGRRIRISEISVQDLERYRSFLKEQGFKTNTRRRKILTVTQFLGYLAKRKKVSQEVARKSPAPYKIERIPVTVPALGLVDAIQKLPQISLLDMRNRVLLWTLAETGCLVSEIGFLRYQDWVLAREPTVQLGEKTQRRVSISSELFQAVQDLKERSGSAANEHVFLGFNKFGSLGAAISSRGIELLVKQYGPRLGFPELTPRTFRHSIILRWFQIGIPQADIQNRLGLKTTYAFRSYIPLLKADLPS